MRRPTTAATGRAAAVVFTACLLAALLGTLLTTGCAPGDPIGDDDRAAIAELSTIAARDAEAAGDPRDTECWSPSEHLLAGTTFRVLCRVHYEQAGAERYRDMICIGDLAEAPIAEYCYPWAYYTDMPAFEDHPGYSGED